MENNFDKSKIAIVLAFAFVITLMIAYSYYVFGDGGEETTTSAFSIPGGNKNAVDVKKQYDNKLEAYKVEEKKPEPSPINLDLENLSFSDTSSNKKENEPVTAPEHKPTPETKPVQGTTKPVAVKRQGNTKSVTRSQENKKNPTKEVESEEYFEEREFYSASSAIASSTKENEVNKPFIKAVIHGTQKVKSNQMIKLRTIEESFIEGKRIPINTMLYGKASIGRGRLQVQITSIRQGDVILAHPLIVYDNDGLEGLNVIEDINQEIANDGLNQGINTTKGTTITTPIVSFSTDALSKKVKDPYVTVPANHSILLKK